jgi:hypothetical protein
MTCKLYIIKWHSFYEEYRIYKLYMPHKLYNIKWQIMGEIKPTKHISDVL